MHTFTFLVAAALVASANARVAFEPSLAKRHAIGTEGDCAVQPSGVGIVTSPDTAEAFQANPIFANAAKAAALSPPAGYSVAFSNQLASVIAGGYLGYDQLTSYDPSYCAQQCGSAQYPTCDSFDIYFERDPTLDPGSNCPNPTSLTYVKCAYYSSCIAASEATNDGQYCADFHIVIAGSNGYTKNSACASTTSTTTTVSTTTKTSTSTTSATTTTTTTTTKAPITTTTTTTTKGPSTTTKPTTTTTTTTTTKPVPTTTTTTTKPLTTKTTTTVKPTTTTTTTTKCTTFVTSTTKKPSTTTTTTKCTTTVAPPTPFPPNPGHPGNGHPAPPSPPTPGKPGNGSPPNPNNGNGWINNGNNDKNGWPYFGW